MRKNFIKLACLFMMLALALTGCNLIKIDPIMQADEDMEKLQKELSTVMASYDGGQITKGDIIADVNSEYSYLYYMYSMYGYTLDQSQIASIVDSVAQSHVNTHAMVLHAEEYGVDLTEEEIAECETAAQTAYDDAVASVKDTVEADTDELMEKKIAYEMAAAGTTYEQLLNQQINTKYVDKVEAAVKAEVTEVFDADLVSMLAEQNATDEQTYSQDLKTFETDMSNPDKVITWMPDGYRTVKHILVKAEDELVTAVSDARGAVVTAEADLKTLRDELAALADAEEGAEVRTEEEINADITAKEAEIETLKATVDEKIAACVASVQDKLDEIYAKLEEGNDFDTVMALYGEDPGMTTEPAKTTGYYVCAQSEAWDTDFRNGAMALEKVGDYSKEPVVSTSGVHIIYYNSDVTAGPVPMEEIRDRFYPVALEKAQQSHMDETLSAWKLEMNPVYTTDGFFTEE